MKKLHQSKNYQPIISTAKLYLFGIAATTICTLTLPSTVKMSSAFQNSAIKVQIPQGFQSIINESGIEVYKKADGKEKLEYVTVVSTEKAAINNLVGAVDTNNETITKKLMTEFWQDAINQNTPTKKARVVINGTFFSTNDDPTGIAFGLKVGGKVITYGYAIGKEYPGLIRVFEFGNMGKAGRISPYGRNIFENRLSMDIVGALDVTANKSANRYLPRTFVGVNRDKKTIFYSSNYARQIDATNTLKAFGAKEMAMLDGGGSTGIIIDGKPIIATNRKVPHAIALYSGK
jgi:Phosphodiester glycosidase